MKKLRKAKGWSQSDLAQRVGVHLTHVSRVETGKYRPGLQFVVKTARAFGITLDALLSEPEDGFQEVRFENKELAERLRLLEQLEEDERGALIKIIDAMLTKHRMRQLLEQAPAGVEP